MMFDMTEMILPTADPSFEWRFTTTGPVLVCRELESCAFHLFTTRHWSLGGRAARAGEGEAWVDVARAMGVDPPNLVRLRQVHGAAVSEAVAGQELVSADILVTDEASLAIAVQGADCVPLLLVDPRTRAVAAAHAGWRGMAARVPHVVVDAMARRYGVRPADLAVAMGPSIGACCYEVGLDVREAFVAAGCSVAELESWFLERPRPTPMNPSMAGVSPLGTDHRWFFDGWTAVRDQLRSAGVRAGRIFSSSVCTASHAGALCSHRREGASAGRIAGAIRSLPRRP
jgi:polyphenol oxidase